MSKWGIFYPIYLNISNWFFTFVHKKWYMNINVGNKLKQLRRAKVCLSGTSGPDYLHLYRNLPMLMESGSHSGLVILIKYVEFWDNSWGGENWKVIVEILALIMELVVCRSCKTNFLKKTNWTIRRRMRVKTSHFFDLKV
jgi:hypothetical protein